jgi:threonine aldolase
VGSLLLGSNDFIKQARRIRKVFGGGMRQAGYLAAAGLYALQNNIDRLKVDHLRAQVIAELLKEKPFVEKLYSVETNLVIFKLQQNIDDQKFLENLKDKGVIAVSMGKQLVRFVMHLDVTDEQFNQLKEIIEDL